MHIKARYSDGTEVIILQFIVSGIHLFAVVTTKRGNIRMVDADDLRIIDPYYGCEK